jgi:hypothetical protein
MANQPTLLVLGIGVSPWKNDGVMRFEHFCNLFGLEYKIIGDGKIWHGGDMFAGTGGGQKINEILEAIENMDNKLIIICDTFDLFPLAGKEEIIKKFNTLCGQNDVLFSSEVYCWPDEKLSNSYPKSDTKYKYLNSGSIMGYRDNIYHIVKNATIEDNDDDQLYFTSKYLSHKLSGEKIVLDHKCELFQALNGCKNDIVIHKNRLYNRYTNSYPVFAHGNGPAKLFLNHIENYLETRLLGDYSYTINNEHELISQPKIFFALYINSDLRDEFVEFVDGVANIKYQNKIIFVYDKVNNDNIKNLVKQLGYTYVPNIQTYIFTDFNDSDCQYYFLLEQRCIITKRDVLHELVPLCNGYHRIIAPLLNCKTTQLYSNFWGALDSNGYYLRSDDYIGLVERHIRGLWNVPHIFGAILFARDIIQKWDIMRNNKYGNDIDMRLCYNLRKDTLFMYMANLNFYGYVAQN